MSDTHNADEVCPIIEDHKCKDNAKVWFSDAVLRVFKTYDERAALVQALRDEVNKIPSNYIPYIMLNFRQIAFVCGALWSEEKDLYLMEIDMAVKAIQVGQISASEDGKNKVDEKICEPATVH